MIAIASNAPNMGTKTGRRRRLATRADQSVERTGGKRDAQEHEPLIQQDLLFRSASAWESLVQFSDRLAGQQQDGAIANEEEQLGRLQ